MSWHSIGWITAAGLFFLLIWVIAASFLVLYGDFYRKDNKDVLEINVLLLWGLFRIHKELPLDKKVGRDGNPAKNDTGSSTPEPLDMMIFMLQQVHILSARDRGYLSHVYLTEWRWETTIGMGDAVWTAMATGSAWSLKTAIIGVISQNVKLTHTPKIHVNPVYDDKLHFSTEWSCIAKIRFGYAILAGLHFMINRKKAKGGVRTWQNIQSKA